MEIAVADVDEFWYGESQIDGLLLREKPDLS